MLKRALAAVLLATTLAVPVMGAPPSAAEPIRTALIGQTAASTASSDCLPGSAAVAMFVLVTGDKLVGARVNCTPPPSGGGAFTSTEPEFAALSSCPEGEVATGLHGLVTDTHLTRLGLSCTGDSQAPSIGSSSTGTPYEALCPTGGRLLGVQVWHQPVDGTDAIVGLRGRCLVSTTTTLTATPAVRYPGQAVTVTSTVAPTPTGLAAPTGLLPLRLDGVEVGDPATTTGVTTTSIEVGVAPVVATSDYGGDDVYAPSLAEPIDVGPTVLTDRQGTEPVTTTTRATSGCPIGSAVTGIRWHTNAADFIAGVYVSCSDGSTGEYAGGLPAGSSPSDCQPGDVAIGFATTSGDVVDRGLTRCDGSTAAPYSAPAVGAAGGNDNGATECPADTVLQGLVVTWAPYFGADAVRTVQGVCGDASDPTVSAQPLPATLLGTATTYRWTAADLGAGLDTYEVALADSSYSSTAVVSDSERQPGTMKPLSGLAQGHTYCTSVIARDLVSNTSEPAPTTCTTVPVDDRAARASKAWRRTTPRTSWNRTATVATAKGATLTLKAVRLERVGIVATTCRTCGKVSVLVGRRTIGTLSLRSSRTRHQRVLLLPAVAAPAAPVRIVVSTTGKTVAIDAIVARTTTPGF